MPYPLAKSVPLSTADLLDEQRRTLVVAALVAASFAVQQVGDRGWGIQGDFCMAAGGVRGDFCMAAGGVQGHPALGAGGLFWIFEGQIHIVFMCFAG